MISSKSFVSIFLLLLFCFTFFVQPTLGAPGEDDDFLLDLHKVINLDISMSRFLQASGNESTNGSCVPNEAKNGIVCTNVTLYQTTILEQPLWVWLNLNTTFDYPNSSIFWTHAWIYVTFLDFNNKLWAEFEFNSTTPNNTWLASGTNKIGRFRTKTGVSLIPIVPVIIEATHNVTLWVDECPDQPANFSWCDSGSIHATLAVHGFGTRTISDGSRATIRFDAPYAVTVVAPYHYSVNKTWFCAQLAEEIVYDKDMVLQLQICPYLQPCRTRNHEFNATTWDVNATLTDQCFVPDIPFPDT